MKLQQRGNRTLPVPTYILAIPSDNIYLVTIVWREARLSERLSAAIIYKLTREVLTGELQLSLFSLSLFSSELCMLIIRASLFFFIFVARFFIVLVRWSAPV